MLGNVIKAIKVRVQTAPLTLTTPTYRSAPYENDSRPVSAPFDVMDEEEASPYQDELRLEVRRNEAHLILSTANQQAAEVLRAAQTQGFEAGRAESLAANESEVRATLLAAQHILEESRLWRAEMLTRSEATVIDLVKGVAEKLFGDGFELPAEQLQQMVNRAIEQARNLGSPRVRLHPLDAARLKPLCPPDMVLVSDESIKRGGCQVEAERGTVDSRIETQLNEINKTLDNS